MWPLISVYSVKLADYQVTLLAWFRISGLLWRKISSFWAVSQKQPWGKSRGALWSPITRASPVSAVLERTECLNSAMPRSHRGLGITLSRPLKIHTSKSILFPHVSLNICSDFRQNSKPLNSSYKVRITCELSWVFWGRSNLKLLLKIFKNYPPFL